MVAQTKTARTERTGGLSAGERPGRGRPGNAVRIVFVIALLLHASFLVSLRTGFLNPLFVEASEGLGQASDFFGIYQAGANLVHGYSLYDSQDYLHQAPLSVPFYYFYRYLPPTGFISGLAALVLPPWPAYWLWVVLCELMVGWIVFTILRWERWPADRRWAMAALWIGFFPFYIEQLMGQFSIVMAAFLWILWRYEDLGPAAQPAPSSPGFRTALASIREEWRGYRWGSDRAGGRPLVLAFAASLALKTYSALLLFPYLRDRKLKRLLWGGGLAAAASLPYFFFRPGDLREFVRLNFTPFTPGLHKGSFGLHNFLRDLFSHLPGGWTEGGMELAGIHMSVPGMLVLAISGAVFVAALWGTVRLAGKPHRAAFDLAIWTAAFFLVFKSIWEYHYVMLLPGITAVYLSTGARGALICGVLLALPTAYVLAPVLTGVAASAPASEWPGWFRSFHLAVKAVPTLALFVWCLREAARPQRASA